MIDSGVRSSWVTSASRRRRCSSFTSIRATISLKVLARRRISRGPRGVTLVAYSPAATCSAASIRSPTGAAVRRRKRTIKKMPTPRKTNPKIGGPFQSPPPFSPFHWCPKMLLATMPATKIRRSRPPNAAAITNRKRRRNWGRRPPCGGHSVPSGHHGGGPPRQGGGIALPLREPVADAVDRLNVARLPRRLDLPAQVLDVRVDRALVRLERDAMDGVEQLRA